MVRKTETHIYKRVLKSIGAAINSRWHSQMYVEGGVDLLPINEPHLWHQVSVKIRTRIWKSTR